MGATDFSNTLVAKTAKIAFASARQDSTEYEAEGYSGTILEKDGYTVFNVPARVSITTLWTWLEAADWALSGDDAEAKKDFAKTVPSQHRAFALKVAAVYGDKFGPAVCLRWTKSATAAYKSENGLKGTQGDVYTFCGTASC